MYIDSDDSDSIPSNHIDDSDYIPSDNDDDPPSDDDDSDDDNSTSNFESILSYPGSKRKAVPTVRDVQLRYFPNIKNMYSPFAGGMSFELDCAARGMKVYANDVYPPLICFWRGMQTVKAKVIENIRHEWPLLVDKAGYKRLLCRLRPSQVLQLDLAEAAALYWVISKRSHRGLGAAGSFSPWLLEHRNNLSPATYFNRCGDLKAFDFSCQDYLDFLYDVPVDDDALVYADPPYLGQRLYGPKGKLGMTEADHIALRNALRRHKNWMVHHSVSPFIKKLYEGQLILTRTIKYSKGRTKKEYIILSLPDPPDPLTPIPPV